MGLGMPDFAPIVWRPDKFPLRLGENRGVVSIENFF